MAQQSSLARQEPVYLPANSEFDVQIWRLTDNTKRRVWFEWAAQTYLVASASGHAVSPSVAHYDPRRGSMTGGTASPPGSVTSGTFSSNHRFSAGSSSAALMSPSLDAFQSAPSPHLGGGGGASGATTSGGSSASATGGGEHRMSAIVEEGEAAMRIKISQTRLHNPGGKTSWIGL